MTRSRTDRSAAVLIPAHSEERTIGAIVSESRRFAPLVVVVDDGSSDSTADIALRAGAHVLCHRTKRGYSGALRTGFSHLRDEGYDTVVTLDADGAHDPRFIPLLLRRHWRTRADLTLGSRFSDDRLALSVPTAKRTANLFARHLINHALRTRFTDVATGMRVLGPKALALKMRSGNFAGAFELIASAARNELRVVEAAIAVHYDAAELHATQREELLDLLSFVGKLLPPGSVRGAVGELESKVIAFQPARFEIEDDEFWLHPIRAARGYVFQLQNPRYRHLRMLK